MSDQSFMPILEIRYGHKKRTVKKSVTVQYRAKAGHSSLWGKDWATFKRYVDLSTAEQAMRAKSGCRYFEYRILP